MFDMDVNLCNFWMQVSFGASAQRFILAKVGLIRFVFGENPAGFLVIANFLKFNPALRCNG